MRRIVFCLAMLVAVSAAATASPIVYQQPMIGPNGQVSGVNTQVAGSQNNPVGANYHYFYAQAGTPITLFGDRQSGHYDMSMWVFQGLFNDTNQFGASFDFGDPGVIAFGDDQDPPNLPGPFGDPRVLFNAPTTGYYTVAVTNFLSSAGPPNPYTLNAVGNTPEPASMALFGGLVAIGGVVARRRMTKVTA